MENNEDNLQYTVIAEKIHLIREDIKIDKIRKRNVEDFRMKEIIQKTIDNKSYAIIVLESLLPKEREMIVKSHEAGQAYAIGSHKDFKQTHPNAEEYYSQFKPYEK